MFEALKKVKAWIELDGTHELGPGPRQSQEDQEEALPALALHDVRLLPRGVPAVQRLVGLHRRRGASTRCASSTCTRAARCTRTSASTRSWARTASPTAARRRTASRSARRRSRSSTRSPSFGAQATKRHALRLAAEVAEIPDPPANEFVYRSPRADAACRIGACDVPRPAGRGVRRGRAAAADDRAGEGRHRRAEEGRVAPARGASGGAAAAAAP